MTVVERLKAATNEPNDAVLEDCAAQAKAAILARRYPFQEWPEELESRYLDLQYRCALAIYQKRGGQYEISHGENGVQRSYASEDIPESLLRQVTPLVRTV